MILKSLKLRFYRNLMEVDTSWNGHFNVIYGQNAQGKTNLLESIYLLGHLKSFRGARGHELINHNGELAWVGATVEKNAVQHQLEIALQKSGRTPKVDNKAVKRLSHFFGYLRTVIFTPEELGSIKGFPAGRRALLDRAILQTDPTYLDRIQEYDRILRQRNQLLKKQVDDELLDPWTESLVRAGSRIRHDRLLYLKRFTPRLGKAYQEITGGKETADLKYSIAYSSEEELSGYLLEALKRLTAREKKLGLTLAGPHRDDIDFLVEERSLRSFGSQGQQRSYLLAFKAAQVIDLENLLNDSPILLLDDLASELDMQRQEGFFNFLLQRNGQVFLTSAQQTMMTGAVRQKASYYKVDQGVVSEMSPE
jgi:DNA replication and repair protein RecF